MERTYRFVTIWRFDASIEAVWNVIVVVEEWPRWWPSAVSVTKLSDGDADGVGAVHRYIWKGRLPYRLTFDMKATRIEKPFRLEGAAAGELAGVGRWELEPYRDGTRVTYEWIVRTTKPWMNLLAPLARPLFNWNHDFVMSQGGEGLARRLRARLFQPPT